MIMGAEMYCLTAPVRGLVLAWRAQIDGLTRAGRAAPNVPIFPTRAGKGPVLGMRAQILMRCLTRASWGPAPVLGMRRKIGCLNRAR